MASKVARDYVKDKGKFFSMFAQNSSWRSGCLHNRLDTNSFDNADPLNCKFYECISEQLKTFFLEFVAMDDNAGNKVFKYRQMLTKIAHREQISFEIDLDDVHSFDDELAMSIANNTRRYTNLVLNVRLCKNYCEYSRLI